ncbi:MAG: aminotransferase class I/II-fold pyridoxal phosphate-dependent enzyme [Candidatus Aureabacteria bacterium]|nr:aminotransferase class I/II-fold pyridoxal phosphate-dependent enzyme [Candidatus Auribacterota bacterium]
METPVIKVGTLNLSETARRNVAQVLRSNRLSYGPFTEKFERQFARLHGCRFGIMTNSGTSALQIALAALKEMNGWADGDEVIVPALTFVATANVVFHNRMTPIFVDVEKDCYGLDPDLLEAKITPRTRAFIPVHLFGMPCALAPIMEIARRRGLKVIEDSCETMFARYQGKWVGSFGEIGCFSTYVAHLIVTGVGGLCTTDDPDVAIKLRSLMNHGRDSNYISIDDDENKTSEELKTVVARRFSFISVGHSFRVTEMEAAIGLAQLEKWEEMITPRRANARYLIAGLSDLADRVQLPRLRPDAEHSFMMFLLTRNSLASSEQLGESLPLEFVDQCLVIDRGSTDGTVEFWEKRRLPVHRLPAGRDRAAFSLALRIAEGEYVVFFELDGSEDPAAIARSLYLLDKGYDLVIASRLMPGGKKSDANRRLPFRGLGNRVFTLLANVLFNGNLTDALTPFRGVRKDKLEGLGLDAAEWGIPYQMSIRALKSNLKITEIPTRENTIPRRDNVAAIFLSIFHILGLVVRELMIGRKYQRILPPRRHGLLEK